MQQDACLRGACHREPAAAACRQQSLHGAACTSWVLSQDMWKGGGSHRPRITDSEWYHSAAERIGAELIADGILAESFQSLQDLTLFLQRRAPRKCHLRGQSHVHERDYCGRSWWGWPRSVLQGRMKEQRTRMA